MCGSENSKLEDARHNFEALHAANDAVAFRTAFNSFLGNCRAVTYALQKQGYKVASFADWYSKKQYEMKNDELLRFIHEARTEDFNEGKHHLRFSTHIQPLSRYSIGPLPQEGASLAIWAQGLFWVVNKGVPQERRIPITQGSSHIISVSIDNPPNTHLGKALDKTNPVTIAEYALEYMGSSFSMLNSTIKVRKIPNNAPQLSPDSLVAAGLNRYVSQEDDWQLCQKITRQQAEQNRCSSSWLDELLRGVDDEVI